MIVVIGHLAIQAIVAFVGIDTAVGVDRLDFALISANPAWMTAFLAPF